MSVSKWVPDRKVLAGGIVGVIAFFASTAAGIEIEIATAIAGSLLMIAEYFIPASAFDVVNKIDDAIKKLGIDPNTPVGEIARK